MVTAAIVDQNDVKQIVIHKSLACHHSPVFKAAFEGPWIEGQNQRMDLKETTADVVTLLIRWLYSNELECEENRGSTDPSTLISLWLLADRLFIPDLQNEAIVYIAERLAGHNLVSTSSLVYDNSLPGSPLRRIMVDHVVRNMAAAWLREDMSNHPMGYPYQFIADIALTLLPLISRLPPIDSESYFVPVPDK